MSDLTHLMESHCLMILRCEHIINVSTWILVTNIHFDLVQLFAAFDASSDANLFVVCYHPIVSTVTAPVLQSNIFDIRSIKFTISCHSLDLFESVACAILS